MRIIAPLCLLALAACAAPANDDTSSQSQPSGNSTVSPSKECDASATQYAVGKAFTNELSAELKTKSGAERLRVIPPDTAVTMDYRSDRLNISHDEKKIVTQVNCG